MASNAAAVPYFGWHGNRLIRTAFIAAVCILIVKTGWDAWSPGTG